MSRKTKITIGVVVALLLVAIALLLWWLSRTAATPVVIEQRPPIANESQTGGLNVTVGGQVNRPSANVAAGEQPAPAPAPDQRANVKRLAAAFAERFGSFSNVSNFENILDLKTFMTATMASWADRYVADAQAKRIPSADYSGTTTRSLSVDVTSFDDKEGKAAATVKTQRQALTGSSLAGKISYQDIVITFIKEGDVWKADSANWK